MCNHQVTTVIVWSCFGSPPQFQLLGINNINFILDNFVSFLPGYTLGYMSNEDQSYDLYE